MPSEQKHIFRLYRFSFSLRKINCLVRGHLYLPPSQPIKAPQNLLLYGKLNSGYNTD